MLTIDASGARVAIVASSWHADIMGGLIGGALRACEAAGASSEVFPVAGSFELPLVAKACALSGSFDVVVALGVVVRGGTPHFEYVCSATTDGVARVALETGMPVGFGLLTVDDEQQALDRAGLPGSREDKGREATEAALSSWTTLRGLASAGRQ